MSNTEDEELEVARDLFDEIDTDKSGTIDFDEFCRALTQSNTVEDVEPLKLFFGLLDTDDDGELCFADFYKLLTILNHMPDKSETSMMTAFFNLADGDGNGTLDADEVIRLCKKIGFAPGEMDVNQFIEEIDTNKDGVIQLDEFLELFKDEEK
ncbi:caltractin, putative [Entamoeba invadens IP1]|uniref:Caltractin, putative n=1 Tax=Entamoeba invadens IP1 TaxID=370355 RepID=A0A0A1TVY7_ENTIV|nr:caltractin, putative [Entamoeba invadens IP1]ELP84662.1 caltractin, putative [Entamoeba invadens IP1]|eukprot:XP_004184008.1 caltractin, putative [Entamoeba invadens IP1]